MKTNRVKYPTANLGASKRKQAMRRHNATAKKNAKRKHMLLIGAGVLAALGIGTVVIVKRRRATKPSYADLPPPPTQIPIPTPDPMDPLPQDGSSPTIGPISGTLV